MPPLPLATPQSRLPDQWAAWELFSTNAQNETAPAGAATQLTLAEAGLRIGACKFLQRFVIYIPEAGSQPSGDPVPQNFIGLNTPEPAPLSASAPDLSVGRLLVSQKAFLLEKRPRPFHGNGRAARG